MAAKLPCDNESFTTIYIRKDIFSRLKKYQHMRGLDTPYESIESLLEHVKHKTTAKKKRPAHSQEQHATEQSDK